MENVLESELLHCEKSPKGSGNYLHNNAPIKIFQITKVV
jgi:hypothetical protein